MKVENIADHPVYTPSLKSNCSIIDIGANEGAFSLRMVDQFQLRSFLIEPNPNCLSSIKQNDSIIKFNIALGEKSGYLDFFLSKNSQASSFNPNISSIWGIDKVINVEMLTLKEFLEKHQIEHIELVKIDAEGSEIEILNSMCNTGLLNFTQITVEFHEHLDGNLRVKTLDIIRRLKQTGFYVVITSQKSFSHVLFLNKKLISRSFQFILGYIFHLMVRILFQRNLL